MNNRQLYKETFGQMAMSDEAIRKVKEMMDKKENRRNRTLFRAGVTAASLAGVFILGNIVSYAATGTSLVQAGLESVHVFIDGKEVPAKGMRTIKDKDGNPAYEIEVDTEKNGESVITINEAAESKKSKGGDATDNTTAADINGRLEKEDGKIYFRFGSKKDRIDITQGFLSGKAKGKFVMNGKNYRYTITGTMDKYDIDVSEVK